jgi:Tol biopolymer transport system component
MSRTTPAPDNLDRLLTAWFESDAQVREPEMLLDGVLRKTSRTRPLPTWRLPERWIPMDLALRFQPRPRLTPILIVLALVAALVAGALIVGSTIRRLPAPFGMAANGSIVFISGGRLTVANPDGSNPRAFVSGTAQQSAPIVSRDGTRIAFHEFPDAVAGVAPNGPPDLIVSDLDGRNRVVVEQGVTTSHPSWSSDGRFIAYARGDADGNHLVIAAADGPTKRDLGALGGIGGDPWSPVWTPDNSALAVNIHDGAIYLVNASTGASRKLTVLDHPEVGFRGTTGEWRPDGSQFLFSAGVPGETRSLYLVGLDGTPEHGFAPSLLSEDDAAWSPDGSLVAFLQQGVGMGPAVVIADSDGHVVRKLDGYYGWFMPAWSPDGTRIAILDDRPGPSNIPGPPVIALLDPLGVAQTIEIPAGSVALTEDTAPDLTLAWQRLAMP